MKFELILSIIRMPYYNVRLFGKWGIKLTILYKTRFTGLGGSFPPKKEKNLQKNVRNSAFFL